MHFIMPRFFINCERWKWNADLRLYVSTHGHFKDEHKRNKACKVKNNYFWVHANGKWLPAHRVVLLTWRPLPVDGEPMTVDHLNSITRDNRLCNLEWVSEEENHRRARENELMEKKNAAKPKKKATFEIPMGVPLRLHELGIRPGKDAVQWSALLDEVRSGNIIFRDGDIDLTMADLFEKYSPAANARIDNYVRTATRAAAEGRKLQGKLFTLIKVK